MTGKWKKAAAVLLAAVMAVLLVPLPTYAKETAKISVGSGSCDIGDEVTISVSVSSSVDIYMCDIWLRRATAGFRLQRWGRRQCAPALY